MAIKITRLTSHNVEALRATLTETELAGAVTVTTTTATFHMEPAEADKLVVALMQRAATAYGTRTHPYRSLHAVRHKVQAAR